MTDRNERELPWIPELAGDYELVRELGRGGTAVVYLARDRELGRDVAIKLIRPAYVQDEEAVARLVREARTVGRLQHPGIVMLLGTRRLGERGLALILQYVPGQTLKSRIRQKGPLPIPEVERVLREMAKALEYAHAHRIVHRDIKPENVYLDEGSGVARLADFGLARGWDSDSGLTMPGTAIGTPTYMSPEQLEGRDIDGRSDLYSLGLVGYEALTGEQPWAGESLYSLIHKQKHEELPPIRERRPDAPEHLVRAVEGCIRKAPEDRWPRARDFLDALAGRPTPDPVRALAAHAPTGEGTGWQGPVGAGRTARLARATPSRTGRRRRVALAVALLALPLAGLITLHQVTEGGLPSLVEALGTGSEPAAGPPTPGEGGQTGNGVGAVVPPPGAPGSEGGGTGVVPVPPAEALPDLETSPAALVALSGDRQEGPAGGILPAPLAVRVVDASGIGIPGLPVTFAPEPGSGTVTPAQATSGTDGSVLVQWQLGSTPGEQRVLARAEGDEPFEVTLVATALPPSPALLQATGGQGQEGTTGQPLPAALSVRVLDADGRPVPGVTVRFLPDEGSGSVGSESALTGPVGTATTGWTLGPSAGSQSIRVLVDELGEGAALTFTAEARPAALPVTPLVATGGAHTCVLGGSGAISCWGANDRGQLGDGSRSGRVQPGPSLSGGPYAALAVGLGHVCALAPDGTPHCWGQNDRGQLGRAGAGADGTEPAPVAESPAMRRIAAGASHTCGISADGSAWCWGGNEAGQLGDGTRTSRNAPTRVAFDVSFTEIAAGWNHTCALSTDGIAFCWGDNGQGQLGSGTGGSSPTPVPVTGGHRFRTLVGGNAHTCGVSAQGRVLCWGSNQGGQLGSGEAPAGPTPRPVDSDGTFLSVAAGAVHSCALGSDGAAWCWGRNLYGQLGDGTLTDRDQPVRVEGVPSLVQIEAFGSHTCGRTGGGAAWCWGYNLDGQLGDGSRQNRSTPTPVP